jgi:ankyrin repeat protein
MQKSQTDQGESVEMIASHNASALSTTETVSDLPINYKLIDEAMLREMVRLLIEKGADKNSLASLNRYTKQIDIGFGIKKVTPLMVAVLSKNIVAIEELIKADCNCDYQEEGSLVNALHIACKLTRVDIVGVLVEIGNADLSLKSRNGKTW